MIVSSPVTSSYSISPQPPQPPEPPREKNVRRYLIPIDSLPILSKVLSTNDRP
jgi:hypothetical protein